MEVEESEYTKRIRNYNVDAQAERIYRDQLHQVLKSNSESYQAMLFSLEKKLAAKENPNSEELEKVKEIANRIRLFDGSVTGEVIKFSLSALSVDCQQRINTFCKGIYDLEQMMYVCIFGQLDDLFPRDHFKLEIGLSKCTKQYNELAMILDLASKERKQAAPRRVNVKMTMLLKLANSISQKDTFDDYKKSFFYELIESAASESDVFREKIDVYTLDNMAFVLKIPKEIHFEVVAGTFNMSMLEQCISNPKFKLPPRKQSADTFKIAKVVASLKANKNKTEQESLRDMFELEKAYRLVMTGQTAKGATGINFQEGANLNNPTVINDLQKRVSDFFRFIESVTSDKQQLIRAQLKECTRKIQVRKVAMCSNEYTLSSSQKYSLVGDSREWGVFFRTENPNVMYFITNCVEFHLLTPYSNSIQLAKRIFHFEESQDTLLSALNQKQESIVNALKKEGFQNLSKNVRELIQRIKVQLCLYRFEGIYKEAIDKVTTQTIRLNTTGLSINSYLQERQGKS